MNEVVRQDNKSPHADEEVVEARGDPSPPKVVLFRVLGLGLDPAQRAGEVVLLEFERRLEVGSGDGLVLVVRMSGRQVDLWEHTVQT